MLFNFVLMTVFLFMVTADYSFSAMCDFSLTSYVVGTDCVKIMISRLVSFVYPGALQVTQSYL